MFDRHFKVHVLTKWKFNSKGPTKMRPIRLYLMYTQIQTKLKFNSKGPTETRPGCHPARHKSNANFGNLVYD